MLSVGQNNNVYPMARCVYAPARLKQHVIADRQKRQKKQ